MVDRFRHRFEKFVNVEDAPGVVAHASENPDIKVMHVAWEGSDAAYATRCSVAEGYMLYLLRRELPAHPCWTDGRSSMMATLHTGQFLLLDLRVLHSALVIGDVDCMSAYISREALQRFQAEHDLPSHGFLRAPHNVVHEDSVVHHLSEALLPALRQPKQASRLYVDHVVLALLSRLATQFAADEFVPSRLVARRRGGLTPWQERRAKDMLLAHLDGRIGLDALAAECRLSRSHFARAFKVSTGVSPLRWLTAQRIAQAKISLRHTTAPLEQIAESCGFSDASHLTRMFARETGQSPGAWRRMCRA